MKKWTAIAIAALTVILAGCDERSGTYQPEAYQSDTNRSEAYQSGTYRPTTYLEYAGTINGQGIPIAHFNFLYNQTYETLLFSLAEPRHVDGSEFESEFMVVFDVVEMPDIARFMAIDDELLITPFQKLAWAAELEMELVQMGIDPDFMALSVELAFDAAVELHLVASRAADFGLSVADVDPHSMEMRLYTLQVTLEHPHFDKVAALGFTDEALRQFAELQSLFWLVYHHIADLVVVTDEELEQAFEQHLYENPDFIEEWLASLPAWADPDLWDHGFKREHEWQLRDEYFRGMMEVWRSEAEIVRKIPHADFFEAIITSPENGEAAVFLPQVVDDDDNYDVYDAYNAYADAILGTWELVSITGWGETDLELLGHWAETFFEDGTGEVRSGILSGDFTWSIQENRLIMDDGFQETVVNFRVTGSTFITYDPDSPSYPDDIWTFRRVY